MARKPNNSAAQQATIDARRQLVSKGMVAGMSSRDMAKDLGVNVHTVLSDMKAIHAEWKETRVDRYDEIVSSLDKKIDGLWAPMFLKASNGSARHAEICIGLIEQMAKLTGAYAATKIEVHEITEQALVELRDELAEERDRRRAIAEGQKKTA